MVNLNGHCFKSATIDGEGVICDDHGVTDFDALRTALARQEAPGVFLYAFDVLELDGRDLRREPWEARRKALASLLWKADSGLLLSEHMDGLEGSYRRARRAPIDRAGLLLGHIAELDHHLGQDVLERGGALHFAPIRAISESGRKSCARLKSERRPERAAPHSRAKSSARVGLPLPM